MQHLAAEERCMAAERELAECKARYATLQKDNDRLEEERRHILSTVLDMTGSRMEELSKNLSFTSHSAESKKRKVDEIGWVTDNIIDAIEATD
jgi:predicted nuclease with TOPRIM domain